MVFIFKHVHTYRIDTLQTTTNNNKQMMKELTQRRTLLFLTLEKSTNLLRCVALSWYLSDCKMNVIIVLITPATTTSVRGRARHIESSHSILSHTGQCNFFKFTIMKPTDVVWVLPFHRVCRSSIKQLQISSWHASDHTDGCFDCAMLYDCVRASRQCVEFERPKLFLQLLFFCT